MGVPRMASWNSGMPSNARSPSSSGSATTAGTRATSVALLTSPRSPSGASVAAAQAASCTPAILGASALARLACTDSLSAAPSFLLVPFFRTAIASWAMPAARSTRARRRGPKRPSSAWRSSSFLAASSLVSLATNSSTKVRTLFSAGSTTSGCASMNASKAAASKPTSHLSWRGSQAGLAPCVLPEALSVLFSFSQSAASFPPYLLMSCFKFS
mmetsp:Transcript_44446/g.126847  ORF Transcript_44446/g.126847 Transcript_44446/m.126847 type:complete len:214 (-) Transcript_44446:537-1178(-)